MTTLLSPSKHHNVYLVSRKQEIMSSIRDCRPLPVTSLLTCLDLIRNYILIQYFLLTSVLNTVIQSNLNTPQNTGEDTHNLSDDSSGPVQTHLNKE